MDAGTEQILAALDAVETWDARCWDDGVKFSTLVRDGYEGSVPYAELIDYCDCVDCCRMWDSEIQVGCLTTRIGQSPVRRYVLPGDVQVVYWSRARHDDVYGSE